MHLPWWFLPLSMLSLAVPVTSLLLIGSGTGTFNQRVQHGGGEIRGMPTGEAPSLAAARGTCGGDDKSLGHDCSP